MMTRNRGFRDLKGIVRHATEGSFIGLQFVNPACEPFTQKDESGHRVFMAIMVAKFFKSNGFNVSRSFREIARRADLSRAVRAKPRDGTARRKCVFSCGASLRPSD